MKNYMKTAVSAFALALVAGVAQAGPESKITQAGEVNLIDVKQPADADSSINQSGNHNKVYVTQSGNGAYSSITQRGEVNLIDVKQTVDADSYINQSGNHNKAYVTQGNN